MFRSLCILQQNLRTYLSCFSYMMCNHSLFGAPLSPPVTSFLLGLNIPPSTCSLTLNARYKVKVFRYKPEVALGVPGG
jgi:hypothetical protein